MNLQEAIVANAQFTTLEVVGEPDRVFPGRHCLVSCYQISEEPDRETWHFSPSFTLAGRPLCCVAEEELPTYSDEEWIANSISLLPNVDYLVNTKSLD
jgi:hypothetical protein